MHKLKNLRFSIFEFMILFIGIVLTYFGFNTLSYLYQQDGQISWIMMITLFTWLMLLVMFIFLSMGVDANRKQLEEVRLLKEIIKDELFETKLFRQEIKILTIGSKKKIIKSKVSKKKKSTSTKRGTSKLK